MSVLQVFLTQYRGRAWARAEACYGGQTYCVGDPTVDGAYWRLMTTMQYQWPAIGQEPCQFVMQEE